MVNLFIFRRDLRILDNIGFSKACNETTDKLLCIFIFTPEQVTNNEYF